MEWVIRSRTGRRWSRSYARGGADPRGCITTNPIRSRLVKEHGAGAPILYGFDRAAPIRPNSPPAAKQGGLGQLPAGPTGRHHRHPNPAALTRGDVQQVMLADEMVTNKGYGPARQLTWFEHDTAVLQVLSSDTTATAVGLRYRLQPGGAPRTSSRMCRAQRYRRVGGHRMGTSKVTNPARTAARTAVAAAHDELATAEGALPQLLGSHVSPERERTPPYRESSPGSRRHRRTGRRRAAYRRYPRRSWTATRTRRETDPPPPRAQRPADGAAAARVQRPSVAGEHSNAYLADPDEIPGNPGHRDPPRRPRQLHRQDHHHRPARRHEWAEFFSSLPKSSTPHR
jgi:hypothetical protein